LELIRIELTEVAVAVDSSLSGISVLTTLGLALFLLLELTFPILFLLENYKKKRIKKKRRARKKK
jgi:Na+/melibiose symporter-like transporter